MSPVRVFFVFLVFAIATQFTVCGLPTIMKRSPQQDFNLEDEYKEPTDAHRHIKERAFQIIADKNKEIADCLDNIEEDEYKEATDCLRNMQEFEAVLKNIFSSADLK